MKKIYRLFLYVVFVFMLVGCRAKESELQDVMLYGYEPVEEAEILLENEYIEFHFIPETAQFYVVDKKNGNEWYSNPENAIEDPIADNVSKQLLQSQIILQYANSAGNSMTLDSYGYSVSKGLYTYEKVDNGINVMYTLGNIERTYVIPIAVPESRMNVFLDHMDQSSKRKIDEYYRRYDINNLRATDDKAALLEQYPDLETERVYVLRDTIKEYLKIQLEDMFAAVGYTQEDYEEDTARYEHESVSEKPIYNVTIQYRLDEDDLVVSVPYDSIRYKKDYPITNLRVLPYFGAGSTEDEGFLFVPDGSGALIRFNNGKQSQNAYYNSVYGWDYGLSREAVVNDNKAIFPVFGINKNNASFLCVLEEGASYASVEADVSRRKHSYNYVLAQYQVVHGETMDISAKSDKTVILYEGKLPEEELVQRYIFCDKPEYSNMATQYRNYLIKKYPNLTKQQESTVPTTVELLGAIDKVQRKYGFPMDLPLPLTTYKEATAILGELTELGWKNLNIKYVGWFNEGIRHNVPTDVDLIKELGSKKDFKNLIEEVEKQNATLYLEGEFQFMAENKLFDGFSINADVARHINRKRIEVYPYSPIWYGERDYKGWLTYLARPNFTMKLVDMYMDEINSLGSKAVSLGSIGRLLGADYNEKKLVSREENLRLQASKLSELNSNGNKLMLTAGNAYAAPYANFIVDIPLRSQGISILDEEIPFYQIALHGLIPYAGQAVNLAENYDINLLKSAETGASLYFVFMDESTQVLQESDYMKYFGTDYRLWKSAADEVYQRFNNDFSKLYHQFIIGHQTIANGVTMTEYEDGTKVIVNYNKTPITYDENEINAQSYKVLKGGN